MNLVKPLSIAKGATQNLSIEDLVELNRHVIQQIKSFRNQQARQARANLFVGNRVQFEDNDGVTVYGDVKKVMRKNALVDIGPCVWRVPLQYLTKINRATGEAV